MKNQRSTRRSFPGRLTLDDWLALPDIGRRDMIHRAQCEVLACHRRCASKACRRHRACCADDTAACERRLWQRARRKPGRLRRELSRLYRLAVLRRHGDEVHQRRGTCKDALRGVRWKAALYEPWNAPALFPDAQQTPLLTRDVPNFGILKMPQLWPPP